jgi:hypothetical protein
MQSFRFGTYEFDTRRCKPLLKSLLTLFLPGHLRPRFGCCHIHFSTINWLAKWNSWLRRHLIGFFAREYSDKVGRIEHFSALLIGRYGDQQWLIVDVQGDEPTAASILSPILSFAQFLFDCFISGLKLL